MRQTTDKRVSEIQQHMRKNSNLRGSLESSNLRVSNVHCISLALTSVAEINRDYIKSTFAREPPLSFTFNAMLQLKKITEQKNGEFMHFNVSHIT